MKEILICASGSTGEQCMPIWSQGRAALAHRNEEGDQTCRGDAEKMETSPFAFLNSRLREAFEA